MFNIVAVSDFNMGAMENKGLNIFNDRLILASPETATDANFESIESVVAHEYFHNWTGNRITCRDWFQLCLKEGLTVFRDQEFSADERSATVQRIIDVRSLKAAQFPEDAGPLAHPVRPETYIEINNFYTATVYEKGAELVRMIETILGPEDFRRGMDLYFERHDGEAATIEDFIRCFEDASGRDLTHFKLWYSQAGTPELVCSLRYDAARKTAELKIEQVLPPTPGEAKKKPLHIPVKLGLIGANGARARSEARHRRADRGRRHPRHEARADVPLRRRALAAGAVAAARLLGARQPHHRAQGPRPRVPDGARQRSLQSLAGRQHLRHAHAHRERQAAAPGQALDKRVRPSPRRSASPSPMPRSSRPIAPSCSSCRANPTSRARSAATSIPALIYRAHRALLKARRHRARRHARGDLPRDEPAAAPSLPMRRAPVAARLRNAALTLLAARGKAAGPARASPITTSRPAT